MQKDANLVELEKCCQPHIFLQNFVLIQPRTSPPKICKILQKKIANSSNFANFAAQVMYEQGMGVEQDLERAVELFRAAHAAGDATATSNLGVIYEQGKGVEH